MHKAMCHPSRADEAPRQNINDGINLVWQTIALLMAREWRRMIMEPSRMVGILAQPLLFLLVFGTGFKDSFRLADHDISYANFFFPGILGLVLLFSSIYATVTLVEDKKCGFFRLVLIGPGGFFGAVAGKVLGTASIGFIQALLFVPLGFFLLNDMSMATVGIMILLLLIGAWSFSLIGVLFAWLCPSASAFHAVMSVVLIPMWLLSGAMFPISDGIFWWSGLINPMAYLVTGLRSAVLHGNIPVPELCAMVIASSFTVILLLLAVKRRPIE